jgi:hypothetical protein
VTDRRFFQKGIKRSGSLSGLKEIAAKALAGSYFAAFSTNRIIIGLQNPQNMNQPVTFSRRFLKSRLLAKATRK